LIASVGRIYLLYYIGREMEAGKSDIIALLNLKNTQTLYKAT